MQYIVYFSRNLQNVIRAAASELNIQAPSMTRRILGFCARKGFSHWGLAGWGKHGTKAELIAVQAGNLKMQVKVFYE